MKQDPNILNKYPITIQISNYDTNILLIYKPIAYCLLPIAYCLLNSYFPRGIANFGPLSQAGPAEGSFGDGVRAAAPESAGGPSSPALQRAIAAWRAKAREAQKQ